MFAGREGEVNNSARDVDPAAVPAVPAAQVGGDDTVFQQPDPAEQPGGGGGKGQ